MPMLLLAAIGAMGLFLVLWYRRASAAIPPETETVPIMLHTGITGTFLSDEENATIFLTAEARDVDARLLAAIRKAEMGGPGREFGVLSEDAPTYQAQATIAANTIRNNVQRYMDDKGIAVVVNGRYTDDFIAYLGAKYAPIGAVNDPTGLNSNWVRNVTTWYRRIEYA